MDNELKERVKKIIEKSSGNISLSFYDLKENNGFGFNEENKVPSASMIKLLIMIETFELVKEGKFSLDDKIEINKDKIVGGSGILKEFEEGHKFSLRELLTLMIIVSDNSATNIIIDLVGKDRINKRAEKLNLESTILQRKMMDSDAAKRGLDNFTSSKDIANILEKIYNKEVVDEIYCETMLDILLRQHERQRLQRFLPEDVKIANKSGDLDNLENDGGIFLIENHPYILVVLINDADSNADAQESIGRISKLIYDELGVLKR
ncbi:class A beta-lactamase-related serine hydrolase [Peptoniphilus sp. MSJ-1]|uniref:Class A beta-lactamase-related serine hydrolase n=2 Tax=Peptoniphilus ovalis TaxID=2841503 RepID=A0ABS6FDQ1_9FIRM|nr:class A beta-lactamase-related serine hydrolase [Peptoniphilus ovalis]